MKKIILAASLLVSMVSVAKAEYCNSNCAKVRYESAKNSGTIVERRIVDSRKEGISPILAETFLFADGSKMTCYTRLNVAGPILDFCE